MVTCLAAGPDRCTRPGREVRPEKEQWRGEEIGGASSPLLRSDCCSPSPRLTPPSALPPPAVGRCLLPPFTARAGREPWRR